MQDRQPARERRRRCGGLGLLVVCGVDPNARPLAAERAPRVIVLDTTGRRRDTWRIEQRSAIRHSQASAATPVCDGRRATASRSRLAYRGDRPGVDPVIEGARQLKVGKVCSASLLSEQERRSFPATRHPFGHAVYRRSMPTLTSLGTTNRWSAPSMRTGSTRRTSTAFSASTSSSCGRHSLAAATPPGERRGFQQE